MAVLKLEPTRAPDFTGTSKILEQAGLSMDRGFEAAQGLLTSYQEGQQERVDNEVFAETAGMNREQIQDYFAQNKLKGRNLSVAGREALGGRLAEIANINRTRQLIASGAAETNRLGNVESRRATAERERLELQTFNRGIMPEQVAAFNERFGQGIDPKAAAGAPTPGVAPTDRIAAAAANTAPATDRAAPLGTTVTGPPQKALPPSADPKATRLMLARTLQAEAGQEGVQGMIDVGSVIHNRAVSGRYGKGYEGVIMKPGQISAWNGVTGYAKGEQGQDMTFEPNAEAYFAADAILSGKNVDQTGGATHYFNPDISQPSWNNDTFQKRGAHTFGRADGPGSGGAPRVVETSAIGSPTTPATDPIAVAVAQATAPDGPAAAPGPGGFTLATPGRENVASGFATDLPTITDPSRTSGGVLPTGPTGPAPTPEVSVAPPAAAAAGVIAAATPPATPDAPSPEAVTAAAAGALPPAVMVSSTPAQDKYNKLLLASGILTGDQVLSRQAMIRAAGVEGQRLIDAADDEVREEYLAEYALKYARNPGVLTPTEFKIMMGDLPGSAIDKIQAMEFGGALTGPGGALEFILSPDVSALLNPSIARSVTDSVNAGRKSIAVLPQFRLYAIVDELGPDPLEGLINYLDIHNYDNQGGADSWFWKFLVEDSQDRNLLREKIEYIATEAGVSTEEAAAGMAKNFVRDPFGPNTLNGHFQTETTIDYLSKHLSKGAKTRYEGLKATVESREDKFQAGLLRVTLLYQEKVKLQRQNKSTTSIDRQIDVLEKALKRELTPSESLKKSPDRTTKSGRTALVRRAVDKLDPADADYSEQIEKLRAGIRNDPKISDIDKRLLLAEIKG